MIKFYYYFIKKNDSFVQHKLTWNQQLNQKNWTFWPFGCQEPILLIDILDSLNDSFASVCRLHLIQNTFHARINPNQTAPNNVHKIENPKNALWFFTRIKPLHEVCFLHPSSSRLSNSYCIFACVKNWLFQVAFLLLQFRIMPLICISICEWWVKNFGGIFSSSIVSVLFILYVIWCYRKFIVYLPHAMKR